MIHQPIAIPEFLSGGGELGQRIREYNWSETPLGEIHTWPQNLRTCMRIMLSSRQPIWIGWGKELIKFYNDPYKAIVGGKHPWALGQPASVVWKDIWKDIEPMLQQVMENDEGTYVESQLLIMERNGYPEETYYTFSYTPIPGDEGGPAGMICANTDDTDRIISERQLKTLTELGKNLTDSRTQTEVIEKTIAVLKNNPYDFPFALLYTISDNKAVLAHHTDMGDTLSAVPKEISLHSEEEISHLLKQAASGKQPEVLDRLQQKIGRMPQGAWKIAPSKAIILPIVQTGVREPYGFLIVGQNPYRLLDEKYSSFFSLIADQLATSFGNVYALEEERKRAEALAEIDRAKTTFFSNISHEFRTPLTLLLGPIEDALQDPDDVAGNTIRMNVAYRNALRMQKLVNTLLDFSRIESGRTEGRFSRVDIGMLTGDLASTFRSAIGKAGMELVFQCHEIRDDIYVDVDMWEKIILNLVSNAFKYTKEGSISIEIKQVKKEIRVSVSDTGVGIPAEQLDKIFDRFHRVENMEGRSQEGTGIGLALVKELVKIHKGLIQVDSKAGKGSVFTVVLPVGKEHLPADKIVLADAQQVISSQHAAFVQEALKWVPEETAARKTSDKKYKVLLADDNADMRDYVGRLLEQQFDVITAIDGEDALKKLLEYKPDLLLSDIMMPKLDGLGLLAKLRSLPEIKNTPVILLSARAGEEAKIEGMQAGADDYLVKPFSAKELVARVDANIRIHVARRTTEQMLEEEVRKRTLELKELNISLQASNNDLQQFAHVASHDLKEPIRKVKTFTWMLKNDPDTRFSEKGELYMGKIDSAAQRMSSMIDGVLNYSMLNATGQKTGSVNLNHIIGHIASDLELLINEKSATLRYADLPSIEGAAVLIYQLFYNLINNSLKFSKTAEPADIRISSSFIGEGRSAFAEIKVEDNGIGFDPRQSEKIFETFARLNPKDKYEGTGLGLSLCKRIVQRHNGSIEARGKKNEGAVFIIRLPLEQEQRSL